MKKSKFKELISIAEMAVNLPDVIEIRTMEVEKHIYLQDDTFNPVVLVFANFISNNLCGENLFKLNVVKSEDTLCFGLIEDDGEDDSKDESSDALRILILIESLHSIFDMKNQNILDMTELVVNWRRSLTLLDEKEIIKPEEHIRMLILNNIEKLKKQELRNDQENKL